MRHLTVGQLREIIAELPADMEVAMSNESWYDNINEVCVPGTNESAEYTALTFFPGEPYDSRQFAMETFEPATVNDERFPGIVLQPDGLVTYDEPSPRFNVPDRTYVHYYQLGFACGQVDQETLDRDEANVDSFTDLVANVWDDSEDQSLVEYMSFTEQFARGYIDGYNVAEAVNGVTDNG